MIGTTVALPPASEKDLQRGPIRALPRIIAKREIVALLLLLEWQSALFWGGLFCASPQATQKPSSLSPPPLRDSISRQEPILLQQPPPTRIFTSPPSRRSRTDGVKSKHLVSGSDSWIIFLSVLLCHCCYAQENDRVRSTKILNNNEIFFYIYKQPSINIDFETSNHISNMDYERFLTAQNGGGGIHNNHSLDMDLNPQKSEHEASGTATGFWSKLGNLLRKGMNTAMNSLQSKPKMGDQVVINNNYSIFSWSYSGYAQAQEYTDKE